MQLWGHTDKAETPKRIKTPTMLAISHVWIALLLNKWYDMSVTVEIFNMLNDMWLLYRQYNFHLLVAMHIN